MRLGVIGAGRIVPFHLAAATQLGFTFEGIVARDHSLNAEQVALDYNFKKCHSTFSSFIDSAESFDAVLIASEVSSLFKILKDLSVLNIPILVEKPIFTDVSQIKDLESITNQDKILVGYNRRYYKTIQQLRWIISQNPGAKVHFRIPELSGIENITDDMIREKFLGNTVHMIDLIQFCLGPDALDVGNLLTLVKTSDFARFNISKDGLKTCEIMFGYSENYSIEVLVGGKRIVIKPFETITTYANMEVLPPDKLIPFRRYIPKPSPQISETFHEKPDQKPGFIGQLTELSNMTRGGRDQIGANLIDAANVSKFALNFLHKFLK